VITADVPPEALAIGRARQVNKPGMGARLRARLAAMKAAQPGSARHALAKQDSGKQDSAKQDSGVQSSGE